MGLSEFAGLVQFYGANPRVFCCDVIHLLEDATSFDFDVEDLVRLKEDFRGLVEGAELPLILRSAWVCPSLKAWNVLEAWLHERHSLDGLHTELCLVGTLAEAASLFDQDELRAVRTLTGFRQCYSA